VLVEAKGATKVDRDLRGCVPSSLGGGSALLRGLFSRRAEVVHLYCESLVSPAVVRGRTRSSIVRRC
jgi:hypothetical protein